LEEAVELIEEKRRQEASKTIKTFDAEPDLMVLNGRYGPYISYKKSNYKLPKAVIDKASELTLEQCMEIIKEQDAKPAKPARGSRKKS
ncbi:MAG: DNA topoisomerase I, partial [Paramuribaculum sp.]|nr:DNA topoisomerase I [Paramuribaculum sp.]